MVRPSQFRKGAFALTTAGAIAASALGLFAAAAQQASLSAKECSTAISVADEIVTRNSGKISRGLIDSFVQFGRSNCNLNIDWKLTGPADEKAFGEFRVRLIAMRTADARQPQSLFDYARR